MFFVKPCRTGTDVAPKKVRSLSHVIVASVIRQKDQSQNEYYKKTKHTKFSEKQTIFTPWYAHANLRALFSCNWLEIEIGSFFALLPTINDIF